MIPQLLTDEMVAERMEILPLMNSQVLASMEIPNMEKDLVKIQSSNPCFLGDE